MREENYLYFANSGGNDTDKDAAMFPASRFRGAVSLESERVEFFFAPQDGTGTTANGVRIDFTNVSDTTGATSSSGTGANHIGDGLTESPFTKLVMEKFANLASGNRKNTTNFTVVQDLNTLPANEGAISSAGISDLLGGSGCAIAAVTITID